MLSKLLTIKAIYIKVLSVIKSVHKGWFPKQFKCHSLPDLDGSVAVYVREGTVNIHWGGLDTKLSGCYVCIIWLGFCWCRRPSNSIIKAKKSYLKEFFMRI